MIFQKLYLSQQLWFLGGKLTYATASDVPTWQTLLEIGKLSFFEKTVFKAGIVVFE